MYIALTDLNSQTYMSLHHTHLLVATKCYSNEVTQNIRHKNFIPHPHNFKALKYAS